VGAEVDAGDCVEARDRGGQPLPPAGKDWLQQRYDSPGDDRVAEDERQAVEGHAATEVAARLVEVVGCPADRGTGAFAFDQLLDDQFLDDRA
jgi:hypothetical protein